MSGETQGQPQTPQLTEAEQQALAKVDGMHTPDSPKDPPATPTLILGKYKTVDDLTKAFTSLQAEFTKLKQGGQPQSAQPTTTTQSTTAEGQGASPQPTNSPTLVKAPETPPAQTETPPAAPSAQIDFAKYTQVIAEKGALQDADYAELETKGFTRPVVDAYVRGIQAMQQDAFTTAHKAAGGQEAFDSARKWASANFNDAEFAAYNEAVAKGGPSLELAVSGLVSRWRASVGQEGITVLGKQVGGAAAGYGSMKEMSAAMSDPRYRTDPAYRREVEAKAAVSKF